MRFLVAAILGLLLAGCAAYVDHGPRGPALLKAVGYGAVSDNLHHSPAQRRLLGIRAAKLDAYRNLAEQVYGLQVSGQSTVSEMMLRNDNFRTYVDAYLQGARVVTTASTDETTYEVMVELDLSPGFYDCFGNHQGCTAPPRHWQTCNGCSDSCSYGCYSYPAYPHIHYTP